LAGGGAGWGGGPGVRMAAQVGVAQVRGRRAGWGRRGTG
jgi:hypothetical protein